LKLPKSAACITGTSVGHLDEVVENAEQTDFGELQDIEISLLISFGGEEIQTTGYAYCDTETYIFRRKIMHYFDTRQSNVECIGECIGEMKTATSSVAVTF
jgi:hypothetical protein